MQRWWFFSRTATFAFMKHAFRAKIYKTGINWAVDVPSKITKQLTAQKGYIRIKGLINGFHFSTSLVPVKNAPYRLFVNGIMMKGGNTALGKTASFEIEQNTDNPDDEYPMNALLQQQLTKNKLTTIFNALTPSRKKEILRYLVNLKTEETLKRNVEKVIAQLRNKEKNTRVP